VHKIKELGGKEIFLKREEKDERENIMEANLSNPSTW